jgi:hypothetical protein
MWESNQFCARLRWLCNICSEMTHSPKLTSFPAHPISESRVRKCNDLTLATTTKLSRRPAFLSIYLPHNHLRYHYYPAKHTTEHLT